MTEQIQEPVQPQEKIPPPSQEYIIPAIGVVSGIGLLAVIFAMLGIGYIKFLGWFAIICFIVTLAQKLWKDNQGTHSDDFGGIVAEAVPKWCMFLILLIPALGLMLLVDYILQYVINSLLQAGQSIEHGFFAQFLFGADAVEKASIANRILANTVPNFLSILQVLNYFTFLYLIMRSGLIVVGRQAACMSDGLTFSFPRSGENPVEPSTSRNIHISQDVLRVDSIIAGTIHFNFQRLAQGAPSRIHIPHPLRHIAQRFMNKCYGMRTYDSESYTTLELRCKEGRRFVTWTLVEQQKIVFDYASVVAISDSVKLKTNIWLNFASLSTGKVLLT
jgi:hypothetical protein